MTPRDLLSHALDDAAALPPTSLAPAEAVAAHRRHRTASYADLVGRLVLTDAQLPEVAPALDGADPLEVCLVVTGGAGAMEPAVRWAARTPGLRLGALAVRLRDEADLAHNAARTVAMVDHLRVGGDLGDEVEVHVEPPRPAYATEHGWLAALDEVAMADLRLRFRTGGPDPADTPAPGELAWCLDAALDRETAFSCAGGLTAVSRDGGYGVLDLLRATRVALDGGDGDEVAAALTSPDPLAGADLDALARARRWFTAAVVADVAAVAAELTPAG